MVDNPEAQTCLLISHNIKGTDEILHPHLGEVKVPVFDASNLHLLKFSGTGIDVLFRSNDLDAFGCGLLHSSNLLVFNSPIMDVCLYELRYLICTVFISTKVLYQ